MEDSRINRINELYKKSKAEGLTEAEKQEQDTLRKEYIQIVRNNLRGTLNNTVIQYEDGTQEKLKKKDYH